MSNSDSTSERILLNVGGKRFETTIQTISAYPNTRNDFPIDPPVNLLCTNEDGKIQSYNTGVQAVVIIPGIGTLRFINGILVDYLT